MSTAVKKPMSVLIADDDDSCRETLRQIVEPEGYRSVLAASGEEAIEIIQEESIQIALFDVHMPRMTGLETVQLVHQINHRRRVIQQPILQVKVVSSHGNLSLRC